MESPGSEGIRRVVQKKGASLKHAMAQAFANPLIALSLIRQSIGAG